MLGAVLILRSERRADEEEDELAVRLQRGGVRAAVADSCGDAAALLQAWSLPAAHVALVGGDLASDGKRPEGLAGCVPLPWLPGAGGTAAIQALVQHNMLRGGGGAAAPSSSQCPQGNQPPAAPPTAVVVGYAMRAAREAQLASQGLLPLLPAPAPSGRSDSGGSSPGSGAGGASGSVVFMPLDLARPLGSQGRVDAVMHKASDELISCSGGGSSGGGGGAPEWSPAMQRLQQQLAAQPDICVVDPFDCAAKVVDRAVLCGALEGLAALALPGGVAARAPRHVIAHSPAAADLPQRLQAAGLSSCPLLVKPLAACGLPHSHSMALALHAAALPALAAAPGGLADTGVVVQEFADHGGLQYKAYALGDKVFHSTRASIADVAAPSAATAAAAAAGDAAAQEALLLRFDSLKSLPTQLPQHLAASAGAETGACHASAAGQRAPQPAQHHQGAAASASHASAAPPPPLHQGALEAVAGYLRRRLGLTLFGFDIVVASATREWLVVDVNYFPNYKGGPPETPAWLRGAILDALARHRAAQAAHGG